MRSNIKKYVYFDKNGNITAIRNSNTDITFGGQKIYEGIYVDVWYKALSHLAGQHVWYNKNVYKAINNIPMNVEFSTDDYKLVVSDVKLYRDKNTSLEFESLETLGEKFLKDNYLYSCSDNTLYLEVELDQVIDLVTGSKPFSNNCIMYDAIANKYHLTTKTVEEVSWNINRSIYKIQKSLNADVTIIKNCKEKYWSIEFQNHYIPSKTYEVKKAFIDYYHKEIYEGIYVDVWYKKLSHLAGQHVWYNKNVYKAINNIPMNVEFSTDDYELVVSDVKLYRDKNKHLEFESLEILEEKFLKDNYLYSYVKGVGSGSLLFSITKENDPHELYRVLQINLNSLEDYKIPMIYNEELLENSVYTLKRFESYSIEVIQ